MKTKDAFALNSFKPAQILQRPYFREFGFGADKTDDEILVGLSHADDDSRQALETKFDTLSRLIWRASEYLKFVKRHADRLERYRRAVAEKHEREQELVKFYLVKVYLVVENLLRTLEQTFRELDDAIKLFYRKTFADRLKTARLATGMNQTKFGAFFGLSQGAISNYELGIREPTLANIVRFAQKLHRPLNWFFEAD